MAFIAAFDPDDKLQGFRDLHEARVPVVDPAAYRKKYQDRFGDTQICVGVQPGRAEACNGSGGGPLAALDTKGEKYQVGIVGWGEGGCGSPGTYDVYTRVSAYADWIQAILNRIQ